jgi:D-arabinan exo alpha-(1,3)/(1,5)-arabinofuranosidase (non-reducing end)
MRNHGHRWTGAALLALGSAAAGQVGGLSDLTVVRDATSARVSSAAPEDWSNRDNRWVPPGQTHTMAEIQGPGVIRHIWLTFSESKPNWLAKEGAAAPDEAVLRMYWDGAAEPAVEAPLGDFFAAGFGHRTEINSGPVIVQGGDSYNCFWPMPFAKSARITVTNESDKPLAALYYQVDYSREASLPEGTAYFCAQYRQEFPTVKGRDYLIADIQGHGHYVGTVMSVRSRSPQWFGEGDDKFYVDGTEKPTMWGTGTEDYFLNAWGMERGTYSCFGVTQLSGEWLGDLGNWGTMYRWHLADPVRFMKSLRVEIEHKGWMSADETTTGKVEGHVEREDDFATVAFWYQVGQPKRFATLPPLKERKLPEIDIVQDGKALLAKAKTGEGAASLQNGDLWTGPGQVFFDGQKPGSWLELRFDVAKEEMRRLVVPATHSYDFGTYRILLDGQSVGDPIDFYSPKVEVKERDLGDRTLPVGEHVLRFECTAKNAASSGFKLGVDSVRLRQRWGVKRPPLGPAPKEK